MDGSEMPFEDVGAVEALLRRRSTTWTETTHHGTLVVCKGVSVLVVFPRETLYMVLAGGDGALLWPFVLVSEHVRLQVLEDTATLGKRAEPLLARLVIQLVAASTLATSTRVLRVKG